MRVTCRQVVSAAAALLLVLAAQAPRATADEPAFTIKNAKITELSGMAADFQQQVYWATNDGTPGRVFALGDDGKVKATVNFGADGKDVEGLARQGERLYIGDIGDNKANRKMVTVYSLINPTAEDATVPYRAWDFVYPDGKGHDAEALLVNTDGRVFIVTKEARGAVYTFKGTPSPQGTNKLVKVGDAPPFVTDGTFLIDGRIALRTYVGLYVLDKKYQVVAQAGLPQQKQGETVTSSLADQASVLIGSEGKNQPVLAVPIPTTMAEVSDGPSVAPTPTGGSTAEGDTPDDTTGAGDDRAGTYWALGVAALVALLAAAATFVLGRRRRAGRGEPTDEPDESEPDAGGTDEAVRDESEPDARAPDKAGADETAETGTEERGDPDSPQPRERGHGATWQEPDDPAAASAQEHRRRADLDWLYEDRG